MSYSTSRVPCKYFQQGRCTRGSSCKFAHINPNGINGSSESGQHMSEADLYRSFVSPNSLNKIERTITNDLRDSESFQQRPLTSAYSYGSPCAVNLISGRDYSPEESRSEFYSAQLQGTGQQYIAQINAREMDMQQCFTHVKSHLDWASRFLQKNTKDLVETGQRSMKSEFVNFPLRLSGGDAGFADTAYNAPPSTGNGAFGQPTSGGAFEAPAFGSSSFGSAPVGPNNAGGAFSKSTAVGGNPFSTNKTSNAFGSSSGNSNPFIPSAKSSGSNAFGQPAFGAGPSPATGSAFGKPAFSSPSAPTSGGSAFGKPAFGSAASTTSGGSAFGQPAFGTSTALGSGQSAFGKPAFDSRSSTSFGGSAFGKPAFGSTGSAQGNEPSSASTAFGQPVFGSTPTQSNGTSAFGKPAFGSTPAQLAGGASPFGQSSPFSTAATNNSNQNISPFGSSAFTKTQAPFGGTNQPFGSAPTNTNSPFAALQDQSKPSPLGQTTFDSKSGSENQSVGNTQPASSASFSGSFGSQQSPFTKAAGSSQPQPPQHKFIQGKPTPEDNITVKELDQKTLAQFQDGHFSLGNVPDIPPPLELIV